MEDKKTFGGYICRRRKELGLTQKEFAQKVYVTESAVSKWERGMSYPDITLVRDICGVLEITEHELLTASDDTDKRRQERLAAEYARTIRRYRHWLCALLITALAVCAIANLRTSGRWFLIAVAFAAAAASLLLVPLLLDQTRLKPWRLSIALGCTMLSVDFLLFACCLFAGAQHLPTLCPALLAGAHLVGGLLFLPVVLFQIPMPETLRHHKALSYMTINSILLFGCLAAASHGFGGDWFPAPAVPLALAGLALPWGLMAVLRYLPVNGWHKAACSSALTAVYVWLCPWVVAQIMGDTHPLHIPVDFSRWDGWYGARNSIVLAAVGLSVLAALLGAKGAVGRRKTT